MEMPEISFTPTVLMYNMKDDARTQAIRQYLAVRKIACEAVVPADYGQSLGALLHLYGFARRFSPAPVFDDEMLVLFDFENDMLDGQMSEWFRGGRLSKLNTYKNGQLDGQQILSDSGSQVTLVAPNAGTYILHATNGKENFTRKITIQ